MAKRKSRSYRKRRTKRRRKSSSKRRRRRRRKGGHVVPALKTAMLPFLLYSAQKYQQKRLSRKSGKKTRKYKTKRRR